MPKIRIYVDTSVFGGTQDDEFMEASRAFFDNVRKGLITILISQQTMRELASAPPEVSQVLAGLPQEAIEAVPLGLEVELLAQAYLQSGALGAAVKEDAVHVAAATVGGADLIVSWNFKHLVNYGKIKMFNGVNSLRGYRSIDIRSPWEVRYDEGEKI